ncbi:lysophospholipid acyltransferase family protein [Ruegeria pomeroyi]|uniref:Lipid A biosynthesis lauroyl acyltransferase, putative n=2 Tax=Ruegeria pomeroyi TaxID=89184 RepID=Q5LR22_RUEPO|nr:lysophospholipid acyltransferase family protein [Ruegeria pomeroyi]HCE71909.1 lauroyl acyltransferase [Ruegeria sp.]AAV95572.1 lipid A biosynthesis lauroyl acyltransferase, putative [Ruegeria pomeroyi DSS-3]NVK97179.1 lysophospholipid acyltransferase family protein [Ruegeria pomeroyi]NVL03989.1 lysophospholipid acyltransferase family protein [Ruegeria pomeroyi]QWV09153.1 lysophospholipid acyltransferase family protein [Ruegeria pomeroyi]
MPVEKSELSRGARASYYAQYLLLRGLIGGMRLLPYDRRIAAMGRLMSAIGPLVGFSKRIRANLELTCPDLPEAEIARLCRAVPDNAGRAIMEHFSPDEFTRRQQGARVSGPGIAAFDAAIARGKPVMLITAHFGHYLATRAALQARGGKPIGCLYRRMANPFFNEIYVDAFLRTGKPMFEQGRRGMMEMVRSLKQGGIIAIVSDLHAHGGAELSFFGKPAVTSVLNAELALKYDAVLIPCYSVRQENGLDFEIVMHDPVAHTDPITMTQFLNDDLEKMVRQHMGQWFWIHRRWKPWLDLGAQDEDVPG